MREYDYDLFVIGGGSGGVRAARLAGQLGKKVALAEEYRIGGTCVVRGCVPKKLYVYASRYHEMFEDSQGFGWAYNGISFDWKKLVAAKDKEIRRLEKIYQSGLSAAKVEIFEDKAVFLDNHTLKLQKSNKIITADKILIATGSTPLTNLPIEGLEHGLTTNELFNLPELPKSIVIAGGGYTAVEFANIFHGLGVNVTLVHWKDYILSSFDMDLREGLQSAMKEKNIKFATGVTITKIDKIDSQYKVILSDGKEIKTDIVVLALGRHPYVKGLGLENTDVILNQSGLICVDNYLKTTADNIWALGDVANHYQLTPVAIHEAMCFIQTVFHNKPTSPDYEYIATAVFSQPEIAKVGLSEAEAATSLLSVEIYKTSFRPMVHSLSGRNAKCFMKLVVDSNSRLIVGAHMLGENAGEIIQLLSVALKGKLTKEQFDATMAVHPTISEEFVTMYQPNYCYVEGQKIGGC
ncbi:glutathione-disulfide reductase [Bartonella sp. DGB1]|uniref:glutathione-disulfide reductase n=1 Tax=Bartonella sp. DGB1 TaxID=3239807 RepID=UPI0035267CE2